MNVKNIEESDLKRLAKWNDRIKDELTMEIVNTLAQAELSRRTNDGERVEANWLKIRAADGMAKIIDEMVRSGKLDSRSALADARLDYGEPFPAKPDEPDKQRCNHCMTISDAELTACPKCGRDDALMFPFEEGDAEHGEPWFSVNEHGIADMFLQLQRKHDALEAVVREIRKEMMG